MINSVIVENTKQDSDHLLRLLADHFPEIKVQAVCETLKDAVDRIKVHKPELLFLDVELGSNTTGFHVLEQTEGMDYRVIFISNHSEYAIRAFGFFTALDYIEKPVEYERLSESINRVKKGIVSDQEKQQLKHLLENLRQPDINKIIFPVPVKGREIINVNLGSIMYCATGNPEGITVHLTQGKELITTQTLNWFEGKWYDYHFCRVHDSYLVNMCHVKKFVPVGEGGKITISDGKNIDVAKRKKGAFLNALSLYKNYKGR